jgi:hypothetical protein
LLHIFQVDSTWTLVTIWSQVNKEKRGERNKGNVLLLFVTVHQLDHNTPPHHGVATLLLKWNQVIEFEMRPRNWQSFSNFMVSRALVKMSVILL